MTTRKKIIVVGAGVSGLAAAVVLAESGHAVTVIEASDHLGGRVRTADVDGIPVELGAEFVHGRPPELLSWLHSLGLRATERGGEMLTYTSDGVIQTEDGRSVLTGSAVPTPKTGGDEGDSPDPFQAMEQLRSWTDSHPGSDMSFASWAAQQGLPADAQRRATAYVEGFNAADAEEISVRSLAVQQAAEDSIDGETALHVDGGYAQLPQRLAERLHTAGGVLRLRTQVVRVQWRRGAVTLTMADDESLNADAALLTLPLGVLQAGSVAFEPSPDDILVQAGRMRMGHVCRMSLVFKRRWWADFFPEAEALQRLSFLLSAERNALLHRANFGVFWTTFPSLAPVLTAWSGGPSARAFNSLDDHAIAHLACAELAQIFGLPRHAVLNELVSHHRHDWTNDPLSLGAYSWVPVGAADVSAKLSEPVEDTLFFAGEHTDTTGNWGTVHGALGSGLRAAAQILGSSGS